MRSRANTAIAEYVARSNSEQHLSFADRREQQIRRADAEGQLDLFPEEEISLMQRVLTFLRDLRR